MIIVTQPSRKIPLSKCFPSTRKQKAGVFKFLQLEGLTAEINLRLQISPA